MENYFSKDRIPYLRTDPFHVVFRSKAAIGQVSPGFYDWGIAVNAGQPTPNGTVLSSPTADLDPNNLYVIENFTFSADINEADFSGAIVDDSSGTGITQGIPRFHLYAKTEKSVPLLKQPIPLPQYYKSSPFPKWREFSKESSSDSAGLGVGFLGMKNTNEFQGAFEARLKQTAGLIGKTEITLILALSVLEVRDEKFLKLYRGEAEKWRSK